MPGWVMANDNADREPQSVDWSDGWRVYGYQETRDRYEDDKEGYLGLVDGEDI
jgi:hypothetical protein